MNDRVAGPTSSRTLPLDGFRIVDCSRLLPCAYGTQLLSDLGAEIVKVEEATGEIGRQHAVFANVNRDKRSVVLDLGSDDGKSGLLHLLAESDAIVESFRPGVMERFGLGYEELHSRFPSLVYASASGYSPDSPEPARPGHDLNFVAASGISQPRAGDEPRLSSLPIADLPTGLILALGILAAVTHARRTGEGQRVTTSLADVAVTLGAVTAGRLPEPGPPQGPAWPDIMLGTLPCYGLYRTADERYISLANIEDGFWNEFVAITGLTQLGDARMATGADGRAAKAAIAAVIGARTLEEWEKEFSGRSVCYAPVRSLAEAMNAPDAVARGVVRTKPDGEIVSSFPATFSVTRARSDGEPPAVGADNARLLTATVGASTSDQCD